MSRKNDGCPCLYTTPCQPDCTCVRPMMSHGCRRCARYGSMEQKRAMAEFLAGAIDAAWKAAWEGESGKDAKPPQD